ncbi:hypothetical protein DPMN_006249 [Dreissena polymorpha]|uniref:Uncharacterized protein n=1 Tax=Dreissena polymorpha TaxID=45954 RepID=A0A9D4RV81_DREPO|nr:hypothetical protein DPMN_006249 [Dreissena polymorpha]
MFTDGRTDIRRTTTGHKSSPEQSGELKSAGSCKTLSATSSHVEIDDDDDVSVDEDNKKLFHTVFYAALQNNYFIRDYPRP